ncbi:MAG: class I SAM-dependent methyltransferase, partial [Gammaproteobacteria bacterium]
MLRLTSDRLELLKTAPGSPGPIYAEFTSGKSAYRRSQRSAASENLARAIGLRKNPSPYVIDAAAGLGADGFVLASLGCRV